MQILVGLSCVFVSFQALAAAAEVPLAQDIERLLTTSVRYGYWNATPEENAAVGISLPFI